MRLWPRSLFGRLVITFTACLLAAQAIGIVVSAHEASKALVSLNNNQWAQRYAQIATLLDSETPDERARIASALSGVRFKLLLYPQAPAAPAVPQSLDDSTAELDTLLRPDLPEHQIRTYLELRDPHIEYRITDVQLRDGSWARFNYQRPPTLSQWPNPLLLESLVLVVAIVLVSFFAVRWITRPLSTLARAADDLGHDIHRPPLPERGPQEVRRAASAFNTMQARLRDHMYERTRILTAVSHDLRTPITRLRLRAELLADDAVKAKFVRDLQDMENMTNATLAFLRGMEDQEPPQSVDLTALVESLVSDSRDTGYDVRLEGAVSRPVRLRPQALRRCLDNLTVNAVRYGKRAVITLQDTGAAAVIRVRDSGPGIPAAELDKVFEPYYRLDSARSLENGGVGLGLCIARNIAELHGGKLVLQNHPEGGLEAILTLPIR